MKNNRVYILFLAILVGIIGKLYFSLLLNTLLFGGDFYFNPFSNIPKSLINNIYSWNTIGGSGLGINTLATLPFNTYSQFIPSLLIKRGIALAAVQKIIFIIPFLLLSLISSFRLLKKVFPIISKQTIYPLLASLIYTTNTYILMIIYGGQFGIALAYAIAPFFITGAISFSRQNLNMNHPNKMLLILGQCVWLSLLILFDIRITYIVGITVIFYLIYSWFVYRPKPIRIFYDFIQLLIIPGLISIFVHAYWLLQILFLKVSPVASAGGVYTSAAAAEFFSFADFSHTLSLLHPNWPENVFGKTYFQRPEFLILPMIAFSVLWFVCNRIDSKLKTQNSKVKVESQNYLLNNFHIIFFSFLGLLGAILAKGINDPFGYIYLWLFRNIPGMLLFRDPTKFYILIALSYSVLVPVSLYFLKFRFPKVSLSIIFILFWIILIRQGIFGQLSPLQPMSVPDEYRKLAQHISSDNQFYRTLWLPRISRFSYISDNHPAIDAFGISKESTIPGVINWLKNIKTEHLLKAWGVRYIIIPSDPMGEIYIKDRKYSSSLRQAVVSAVSSLGYVSGLRSSGNLLVFETNSYNDRLISDGKKVSYQMIDPTEYRVSGFGKIREPIIFSESFDYGWEAQTSSDVLKSIPTDIRLNSFIVPEGTEDFRIFYKPQKYVRIGKIISGLSIGLIMIMILKMFYDGQSTRQSA